MRFTSIIILLALLFSIVPMVSVGIRQRAETTSIVSLDVCHNQAPEIFAGPDVLFTCENAGIFVPLRSSCAWEQPKPLSEGFLIACREDQPPES